MSGRSRIGGGTHVVGVIGWPVSGSLSPAIHNAAFEALGLDWVYVPLPVPPGAVAEAVAGLAALGFAGANVTMPHKTDAAHAVDVRSEDAERLRAVNTIVVGPEGLAGHNTDVSGFDRFVRADAAFEPRGRTALLLGAGGAARAVALALARGGLRALVVATREQARAGALEAALEGLDTELAVVPLEGATEHPSDLVVNATPLGREGESLPLPPLGPETVAVDLVYGPGTTSFVGAATAAGARAFGGLGLLLNQAALSFELWTGREPPLEAMSAAAVAALSS